jgi:lysophospholipid acyltransferase
VTQRPLPTKIYYDIFTWLITQLSFTFTVVPFILLQTKPIFTVWTRVYFYAIDGVVLTTIFFASPGRAWLQQRLNARMERPELTRTTSDVGDHEVMFGVPVDAEKELQQIAQEVRKEIAKRKREGLTIPDVRTLVREKLGQIELKAPENVEQLKKEM